LERTAQDRLWRRELGRDETPGQTLRLYDAISVWYDEGPAGLTAYSIGLETSGRTVPHGRVLLAVITREELRGHDR
jgi:hypothetical protein